MTPRRTRAEVLRWVLMFVGACSSEPDDRRIAPPRASCSAEHLDLATLSGPGLTTIGVGRVNLTESVQVFQAPANGSAPLLLCVPDDVADYVVIAEAAVGDVIISSLVGPPVSTLST